MAIKLTLTHEAKAWKMGIDAMGWLPVGPVIAHAPFACLKNPGNKQIDILSLFSQFFSTIEAWKHSLENCYLCIGKYLARTVVCVYLMPCVEFICHSQTHFFICSAHQRAKKLFIGGLAMNITEDDATNYLKMTYESHDTVNKCELIRNNWGEWEPKGFRIITNRSFSSLEFHSPKKLRRQRVTVLCMRWDLESHLVRWCHKIQAIIHVCNCKVCFWFQHLRTFHHVDTHLLRHRWY